MATGNTMYTSDQVLDFINKLQAERFFVLVTLADCVPCSELKTDLSGGALEGLNVLMLATEVDFSRDYDIALLSLLGASTFPLLALVENGKCTRKWSGYFDLNLQERAAAFRTLVMTAWGVSP